MTMKKIKYWQAINEALEEEMRRDESVFVLGEGVEAGFFMMTTGLVEKFGRDRVIDTPLSEAAIGGAAMGAALAGYRPVADFSIADFMYCAAHVVPNMASFWHLIHGGKVKIPCVFLAGMGGYSRVGPEHSQCPETFILQRPGLKLVIPSTPYDAKGLMKSAIRDNNPVVYFFHKRLLAAEGDIPEEEYLVPLGVADVKKKGKDVTVVATSFMVKLALDVAKDLEGRISVEVVDPRSLEPLDMETILESVRKTKRVVIVDEDTERCGPAAEIAMQIMEKEFDSLDAPIKRVCAANYPIAAAYMEELCLPQPKQIKEAIEAVMT
jgi:acetoin:2,6-dichlorophenolindophenol oxidoreductase subunit beta